MICLTGNKYTDVLQLKKYQILNIKDLKLNLL